MKKNIRIHFRNASIPTSSFADIAFLLIVFFLLTTFIAITKGVFYSPPKDTGSDKQGPFGIHLYLDSRGILTVDGKQSGISNIKPYLIDKLLVNPNKIVIIHCSLNQSYQKMMEILDEVKRTESELYEDYNKGKSLSEMKHIKIHIPTSEEAEKYSSGNI